MFRQLAQQMGLQNVRAILTEQIDLLINTSISDIVNQTIAQNIAVTSNGVLSGNSKIGQINSLITLYKTKEVNFDSVQQGLGEFDRYKYNDSEAEDRGERPINPLYWIDFSVNYIIDTKLSNWFPVRIVEDTYLSNVLNDFILKPTLQSPILTVTNNVLELYVNLNNKASINKLRISYIKKPNKVRYNGNSNNEECDLPEHKHVEVVKHAVELYQIAVSGSLAADQARQQRAIQDRSRTANRSEND